MTDPNVLHPTWDRAEIEPPFLSRAARVGAQAGAQRLGATVYELEADGAVSPYHAHHGNEELLVVLSGSPRLRTPQGSRRLDPGAVVAFLPGPDGGHRVSNPGPEPARVLLISTMRFPEIAEHLSTGTTLAMTSAGEGKVFGADGEGDLLTLFAAAMQADAEHDAQQSD